MTPTIESIRRLLQGRRDTATGTARAYEASGYAAEALLQKARASAYQVALDDLESVLRVEREQRAERSTLPDASGSAS